MTFGTDPCTGECPVDGHDGVLSDCPGLEPSQRCCPQIRQGIDGWVGNHCFPKDPCCPPHICQFDECCMACSFVAQLPSGPMWDYQKERAIDAMENCEPVDAACVSLVNHAIYTAKKLHCLLNETLWPSIRESHPATAYTSLDSWLDRLGWSDCAACECYEDGDERSVSVTEYLESGDADGLLKHVDPLQQLAVKRGIAMALHRLRLRPWRTLDNMNFIIAPLGARVEPVLPTCDDAVSDCPPGYDPNVPECCPPDADCIDEPCKAPLNCCEIVFKVCRSGDELELPPRVSCMPEDPMNCCDVPPPTAITECTCFPCDRTTACYQRGPDDLLTIPAIFCPGVKAADCIIRSLFAAHPAVSICPCDC